MVLLGFEELLNELYGADRKDIFWKSRSYGDAYG